MNNRTHPPAPPCKVLIAGSGGYIGRHVSDCFRAAGYAVYRYQRPQQLIAPDGTVHAIGAEFSGYFAVVINCARPHWAQFAPAEIANIESQLLIQLEQLAAPAAVKIHTSGVWLFGHASPDDLLHFRLQPFAAVAPDVATINYARAKHWHIVYCPSLVYGGHDCQLLRIIATLPQQTLTQPSPARGYNQYVHVNDVAQFYHLLVQRRASAAQHFIAEPKGYTPTEFAQLLLRAHLIRKVQQLSCAEFANTHGRAALEVAQLQLQPPLSPLFNARHSLAAYLTRPPTQD